MPLKIRSSMLLGTLFCLSAGSVTAEPLVVPDPMLNRGKPAEAAGPLSKQIFDRQTGEVLSVIFANPWGVKSGTGASTIAYDGNGIITSTIKYSGLNATGVNGYPFIGYGADAWGFQNGGVRGGVAKFPARLDSLVSLIVETEHSLSGPQYPDNLDVAFDIWLVPRVGFSGGRPGAVEVMVMYHYDFKWQSPCKIRAAIQVPAIVDDKSVKLSFAQRVCVEGSGAGSYVAYTPLVHENMEKARIRLDLKPLLDGAVKSSGIDMTWYVSGIQFGTEYGNTRAGASVDYHMVTRHFSIEQVFKAP